MAHDYKSGWVPSNFERYNRFMTALVHGEDWSVGVKYFAIYWLQFHGHDEQLPSPLFENLGDQQHAEDCLMKHLRLLLSAVNKHGIYSLKIMQSASPCLRCSEKYYRELKELATRWNIKVTIVFSSLYKIMRPSCEKKMHTHGGFIEKYESDQNKKALLKLALKSAEDLLIVEEFAAHHVTCISMGPSEAVAMRVRQCGNVERTIPSDIRSGDRPSRTVARHKRTVDLRLHNEPPRPSAQHGGGLSQKAGLNIRTTHYGDWLDLRSALQLPSYSTETYSYSSRKREDDALKEDMREMFAD